MSNVEELEDLAGRVWEQVCKDIAIILEECHLHGLAGILTIPDPSIENRINALKRLDHICQLIIDSTDDSGYSTTRIMFNAKQQILNLERLLTAAKNNDDENFEHIKELLNNQSSH